MELLFLHHFNDDLLSFFEILIIQSFVDQFYTNFSYVLIDRGFDLITLLR